MTFLNVVKVPSHLVVACEALVVEPAIKRSLQEMTISEFYQIL